MSKYDAERERKLDQRNPKKYLWETAKKRADKLSIEFDIEIEDIYIPLRCPILDVELSQVRDGDTRFSPSLDRKNTAKGYIKDNVFVISWQANRHKSNMSKEDIHRLTDYVSS